MSTIQSRDISVVVQGPIHRQDELTKRALESVRLHLPEAELILSTWKGSDVSGLDCDVLLLNDDPGTVEGDRPSRNLNRQIVSTRNGLQKATRHYAMKLRTDTLLTGTGFLDAFDQNPERRDDFKVFQHKIVIPTLYTRNPIHFSIYTGTSYFFHPSDIFQFGLTSDLSLLWDIPLATPNTAADIAPETYIWSSCMKATISDIDYVRLPLFRRLKVHQIALCNNFIVETPTHLGIKLPDRLMGNSVYTCYTFNELRDIHLRYIINGSNYLPLSHAMTILLRPIFILTSSLELNFGLRRFFEKTLSKRAESISRAITSKTQTVFRDFKL